MFEFKEHYFTYELWNALRLNSFNQVRMYEILKQNEHKGNMIITLDELRYMLNISQDEYQRWDRFKYSVLESCKTALAEKTDIKYTYEPIRNGRGGKVTGLNFSIKKNKDYVDQICLFEYIEDDYATSEIPELPHTNDKLPPIKKTSSEKKKALDEAKESVFWYYAKEKAKKAIKQNKNIKATPEIYAVGIIKNWNEIGYKTVLDLKENGEISQEDIDKKPSFDLERFEKRQMEKYKK
jgi:plasmid replication initiation protein